MTASPSLKRSLLLGRSAECDVVLNHPEISGRHAILALHADGSVEVQDMGSKNGVLVNGERILSRKLKPGDVVMLGSYQLDWEAILRNPPPPAGGSDSPTRATRVPTNKRSVGLTAILVIAVIAVIGAVLYFVVRPWVFQK